MLMRDWLVFWAFVSVCCSVIGAVDGWLWYKYDVIFRARDLAGQRRMWPVGEKSERSKSFACGVACCRRRINYFEEQTIF